MSIRAISWAFDAEVPPTTKLVLLKLADNSNDDGYCWPSQSTIARHTGLTRETINRHIRKLRHEGLVEIRHRMEDGVSLPNHYRLNLGGVVTENHRGCDGESQGVVTENHTEPSVRTVNESNTGDSDESTPTAGEDENNKPTTAWIIDQYHEHFPAARSVEKVTSARRKSLSARTSDDLKTKDDWTRYFEVVAASSFLMGRHPPGPGRSKPFRLSLDFLINETRCAEIMEGKFDD